jgi:hypothetical protein
MHSVTDHHFNLKVGQIGTTRRLDIELKLQAPYKFAQATAEGMLDRRMFP